MHPTIVKRHGAIAAVSPLLAPAVPHDEVSAAGDGDVFISDNRHRMPAVGIDSTHSDMSPARGTVQCGSCECLCGFFCQEQRIPTRKQGERVVDVDGTDGMARGLLSNAWPGLRPDGKLKLKRKTQGAIGLRT
jgi:hypothetical protein